MITCRFCLHRRLRRFRRLRRCVLVPPRNPVVFANGVESLVSLMSRAEREIWEVSINASLLMPRPFSFSIFSAWTALWMEREKIWVASNRVVVMGNFIEFFDIHKSSIWNSCWVNNLPQNHNQRNFHERCDDDTVDSKIDRTLRYFPPPLLYCTCLWSVFDRVGARHNPVKPTIETPTD